MSAICGIFHTDGRPLDAPVLDAMVRAIDHRGIDGSGSWRSGSMGLGHQMLHITPQSLHETLPFYRPEAHLAITADARLDNREELYGLLAIDKDVRPLIPDSQLILKAYEKWGSNCAGHLLGDFAFAIWDAARGRLFCVTDPMGVRPLFYYHGEGLFVFSSEIKAIHAVPGITRSPNLQRIAMLSVPAMLYQDKTSTFFENVRALPASTSLAIDGDGMHSCEHWAPDISRRLSFKTEDDYIDAFQDIFFKAVEARLRSAFPIASMLSGGLDSSAVTGTAADLLVRRGQSLISVSSVLPPDYSGEFCDERAYIDQLRIKSNIKFNFISDAWRGPFDDIDVLIRGAEVPTCPSTHYLNTALIEAAGQHKARVILNGLGGEFGPTFHGAGCLAEWFVRGHVPTLLREMSARAKLQKRPLRCIFKSEVIKPLLPDRLLARWKPRFELKHYLRSSPLKVDFVRAQLGAQAARYGSGYGGLAPNHRTIQLNMIHYYRNYGHINLNFGCQAGYERIEMSAPFFDRRIIDFCLALPIEMKMRKGYGRYMIRAGMRGVLPDMLRFRTTKEPYSPDFNDRYNRQLAQASDILASTPRTRLIREIVDIDGLERMLKYRMRSNRSNTPEEFAAMHNVPRGLYLLAFLKSFG